VTGPVLHPIAFDAIPGWTEDQHGAAIGPLRLCARHAAGAKPYRTGSLGIAAADFSGAFSALGNVDEMDDTAARSYFEWHFVAVRMETAEGPGFVTGYYEPEIGVRDRPSGQYRYPFYRRPPDLVDVDHRAAPALAADGYAFGRQASQGIVPYHDRAAIEGGMLDGMDLEIAWAADRVDVFFAHIQGSARLLHEDGRVQRIAYAAKSGHPFTAIGRVLIEKGELAAGTVTMASIRRWLAEHPARLDEIMHANRSFNFFREADQERPEDGPVGAAKVPLSAGRSVAVDRAIHTFGTPVFVDAPTLMHLSDDRPFRRLMIAQDTGTAIVGPARGDLFTGSGDIAGALAGSVKHPATFYLLLPRQAAERLL
jgi:membrane-bound lytic murein transglycosylase A